MDRHQFNHETAKVLFKGSEQSSSLPASPVQKVVSIYENVPDFAEEILESLYQTVYCTTTWFRTYGTMAGVHTYFSTENAAPACLILFRIRDGIVSVLNEQINLHPQQLSDFCTTLLARYKTIHQINFYALDMSLPATGFPYPFQEVPQIEENIICLPASRQEFLAKLPAQRRRNLAMKLRKMAKDHPSHEFKFLEKDAIGAEQIGELVRLAGERMRRKGLPAYIGHADVPALVAIARTHGSLGLIMIDDKIAAASLVFSVGERRFSRMIAHDPAFDAYGLGILLQFQVILHHIDGGARQLWMMGGAGEDKTRFLAERRMFNSITVYRSRRSALRGWRTLAANEYKRTVFELREKARTASAEDGPKGRALVRVLQAARAVRSVWRKAG